MTPEQLRAAITYANGQDARVQMTAPNAELWGRILGHYDALKVKVAIMVYNERYPSNGMQNPAVTPAVLRRIIQEEDARSKALEDAKAITAAPVRTPSSFRTRNPEEWDRLVRQGRDDQRAQLRARGITPHVEACPDCAAVEKRAQRKDEMRDAA